MKVRPHHIAGLIALALSGTPMPAAARADGVSVERDAAGSLVVTWRASGAIDLYEATRPDAGIAGARLLSAANDTGRATVKATGPDRPYFFLRDQADGSVVEAAERAVPLAHGSNFRDLGGYPATGGKHVRWGLIYRSGASAMVTDADLQRIHALGLRDMIDLRSDEERVLAPSRIDGVAYSAVGYPLMPLIQATRDGFDQEALYRGLPTLLAPHLRVIFGMLERKDGPIVYNCSAGQDRTGFVSAMILSALGVSRDVVVQDYLLSTRYRHPRDEMPHLDPAFYGKDPVARVFVRYQDTPAATEVQPLLDGSGKPYLDIALAEIQAKWGSVDNYLRDAVGVDAAGIARIRANYLE